MAQRLAPGRDLSLILRTTSSRLLRSHNAPNPVIATAPSRGSAVKKWCDHVRSYASGHSTPTRSMCCGPTLLTLTLCSFFLQSLEDAHPPMRVTRSWSTSESAALDTLYTLITWHSELRRVTLLLVRYCGPADGVRRRENRVRATRVRKYRECSALQVRLRAQAAPDAQAEQSGTGCTRRSDAMHCCTKCPQCPCTDSTDALTEARATFRQHSSRISSR